MNILKNSLPKLNVRALDPTLIFNTTEQNEIVHFGNDHQKTNEILTAKLKYVQVDRMNNRLRLMLTLALVFISVIKNGMVVYLYSGYTW